MKNMQFLIISHQYGRDSGILIHAIRCLSESPHFAASEARIAAKDEKSAHVSEVRIYAIEPNKRYDLLSGFERASGMGSEPELAMRVFPASGALQSREFASPEFAKLIGEEIAPLKRAEQPAATGWKS